MSMRRRLFTLGGTEIYLHLATALYGLYMVLLGHGEVLGISLLSILLHETAHAVAATCFGKPPQEIEITPLGAVMRLEDEESLSPGKRLAMLLAGPAASFLLCWAALWLTRSGLLMQETGRLLFGCNLLLLLGNLLPALPMDGGRMLALLLSLRLRGETVKGIMRGAGTCIGLAFICLNLLLSIRHGGWNLSLAMAGCFLMYASAVCTTTTALAELRMFMDRKIRLESKGTLPCRWVAVTEDLPLCKAVRRLSPGAYTMFVCVDPSTISTLRTMGEGDIIAAYLDDPTGDCSALFSSKR